MRALSLWQPWASLWAAGVKIHETRGWKTMPTYRGPVVIHAAATVKGFAEVAPAVLAIMRMPTMEALYGPDWRQTLPLGALIGICEIVDAYPTRRENGSASSAGVTDFMCGNFASGRWAIRGDKFRVFKTPIPWRGQQKWFQVPDDVIEKAL